ncbi:MAG: hypothetical protein C5B58_16020 [Acidobacteria bacterium]|nr:MAG: hypothetical protein C5B58_16020 [Acidobacteriota bacterium]
MLSQMDSQQTYLTTSHLRAALGISWYAFEQYLERDVIPLPDAVAGKRPLWLSSSVESIKARIAEYERFKTAAANNFPQP